MILLAALLAMQPVDANQQVEAPSLLEVISFLEPYLECRKPYAIEKTKLEIELYGDSVPPNATRLDQFDSDPRQRRIDRIEWDARENCGFIEFEDALFSLLPGEARDKGPAVGTYMSSAELMQRAEIILENGLHKPPLFYVSPSPPVRRQN